MNELALVSIAIPAFNPEFFRSALQSAIAQDYPHLDILVCDDSRDGLIRDIVQKLQAESGRTIRYVRNSQTLGFARNLQVCLEHARGSLIKFLCDDDRLLPECISHQARAMNEHPDISITICQRLLCAADDALLPARMLNAVLCAENAVIKGSDLLETLETNVPNLFGGLTHALLRREWVAEFLPALVQQGQGFNARLDLALCICLLRRGHLCSLTRILSIERLYAGRLSNHASMTIAFPKETEWLREMLAARVSEPMPVNGWVRYLPLEQYRDGQDIAWQEFELNRLHSNQQARLAQQVGTESLTSGQVYAEWLACRRLSPSQLSQLPKRFGHWPRQPRIVPVIWAEAGEEAALRVTLESLAEQSYGASDCWVLAPTSLMVLNERGIRHIPLQANGLAQLNERLALSDEADWIFLLRAGDRLHPQALAIMGERMALRADRLCLYVDEGTHDGLEASAPVFKPDFNLDLMRSIPYVGRLLAFECNALREAGGFDLAFDVLAPHDLLWRLVERHGLQVVEHIDELLVQCQSSHAQWLADPRCVFQAPRVVDAHLQRLGVQAQVNAEGEAALCRVRYGYDCTAGVSVMLPVGNDLAALTRCVESLFEHTLHSNFELLLLATAEAPEAIRQWLGAMHALGSDQLRVVEVEVGSRAAQLNQASQQARGDFLLLLRAACVAIDGQWLGELLSLAQRPEVGVVGPKLCNPDGSIQAAGIVLGFGGTVGTPFAGFPLESAGYMQRLKAVQNWSAVSLDGMLVRREIFSRLGGLDSQALENDFHGADFCLRVREQGYLVVWTPHALLAHSGDTGEQAIPAERWARSKGIFYDRWLASIARDPAYNRNLSLKQAGFKLEPGLRSGWDPFISRALPSVLALPVNTTAIGHYRVIQPFNELEKAGWIQGRLSYSTPGLVELERMQPEFIVFQCRYSESSLNDMARTRRYSNARRIYEIDDYVIDVPSKNDHGRNMPGNMREMVAQCIAQCDRVVVTTETLADALSSMHHDIRIVPNMLSAQLWTGLASQRQTSPRPRVGWAGGTSHRGDLELLFDVVRMLADEVDWVFFGMCPDRLRPYVKEFHRSVPLARYPQKLASLNLDLALAPLEQNLFNDCKSNLRLLEYGACGFPVICTDTRAYAGYLPCTRVRENTTDQWLDAIRMHLADPGASYRQGDALREVVLRDYVLMPGNLQQWANAWLTD
ncbi:glycosyltransferase [Pseudomonas sp. HLMP]|uniref:glycosyltransferase n=1 Tax=Pseudomonas sp. HLMP TaxID=3153767 RepID=UPI003966E15F